MASTSPLSPVFLSKSQTQTQPPAALPVHVAIIMDGNGRWARTRGLPRTAGHTKGAESLRLLLEACKNLDIAYLTVFAFSSENWKRPPGEIHDLMQLLKHYLTRELDTLIEHGIRLRFIGDLESLPQDIRAQVFEALQATQHQKKCTLTVALSYGARQEITRAAQTVAAMVKAGTLEPQAIDETLMDTMLYTTGLPDPDLLIRTGGEQRLSNFLLWQSAYTELYFTPVLWPDFTAEHFREALDAFAKRERRYGTAE